MSLGCGSSVDRGLLDDMSSSEFFEEKNVALKVVVVIPTLNEEKAIGEVIDRVKDSLRAYECQVLVVDGHSTDRTVDLASAKGATVIYQESVGYGDALLCGFRYAKRRLSADAIAMLDGDGTYDPKDLPRILQPLLEGKADFVVGNRLDGLERGAMTFTNRVGNRLLSWVTSGILKIDVGDTQCGFRAFRSELVEAMDLKSGGMPFATEMLVEAKQAGAKIVEVPIVYHRRVGETKLHPLRDGLKIFGVFLRLTRDYEPLLFFGGFGLILFIGGLLFGLRVAVEWLTTGRITHLASVILSALLVMSSIQLFSLGLVADMIKGAKRKVRSEMRKDK